MASVDLHSVSQCFIISLLLEVWSFFLLFKAKAPRWGYITIGTERKQEYRVIQSGMSLVQFVLCLRVKGQTDITACSWQLYRNRPRLQKAFLCCKMCLTATKDASTLETHTLIQYPQMDTIVWSELWNSSVYWHNSEALCISDRMAVFPLASSSAFLWVSQLWTSLPVEILSILYKFVWPNALSKYLYLIFKKYYKRLG